MPGEMLRSLRSLSMTDKQTFQTFFGRRPAPAPSISPKTRFLKENGLRCQRQATGRANMR